MDGYVKLAHGSGRGQEELLHDCILPCLYPKGISILEDASILPASPNRLAFTTDSFVVSPIEFPGGNIGKLAACGTINDLSMMGAIPLYMAVSLILEEGLSLSTLQKILVSLQEICQQTNVTVRCGDTKVVPKGKADKIFITTTGIGHVPEGREISAEKAQPGDAVIVSGSIGQHGIAILAQREGLRFATSVISDCASLHPLVECLLADVPETRVMRDATRGGCSAVLNEISQTSHVTIMLDETSIPVLDVVQGACSFLGLDPLQIANEGTMVAIVPGNCAEKAIGALRKHPLGFQATQIGQVVSVSNFPVIIRTRIGGHRIVEMPPGELLPRIC